MIVCSKIKNSHASIKWKCPAYCNVLHIIITVWVGTHDVQNVSVNSVCPGQIRVTGDFVDGSTVTRVLIIVYSQSDVRYITSKPADQEQNINVTVTSLTDTCYGVSIFTVENGLPFPRVVASPRTVDVDSANEQGESFCLFHLLS